MGGSFRVGHTVRVNGIDVWLLLPWHIYGIVRILKTYRDLCFITSILEPRSIKETRVYPEGGQVHPTLSFSLGKTHGLCHPASVLWKEL